MRPGFAVRALVQSALLLTPACQDAASALPAATTDVGSGGMPHEPGQAGGSPAGGNTALSGSGGSGPSAGSSGTANDGGAGEGGAAEGGLATKLVHPGILSTAAELAAVAEHLAAQESPWTEALQALKDSAYASLDYVPTPYALVECGSYNDPNVGCTEQVEDGMAAYTHALLWYLEREQSHADKAIEIIDAWSWTYQENTESNARLVVAWATPWFANGAELLRYSDAGWSEQGIRQFSAMLETMLPYVAVVEGREEKPENNWMQSRIEAHLSIAVFLDDPEMLATALERWSFWLPYYIYRESDGATPLELPERTLEQTLAVWDSASYVDGLSLETCRDLGHLGLGFSSMIYAAETAWHQGVDVFAPNQERLADFMELHGAWMTGSESVPGDICGGVVKPAQNDAEGISPPDGGGRKVWELAYQQLHKSGKR
jgi:hypothetical protein